MRLGEASELAPPFFLQTYVVILGHRVEHSTRQEYLTSTVANPALLTSDSTRDQASLAQSHKSAVHSCQITSQIKGTHYRYLL